MRNPVTIRRFCLQLRMPQQLNWTIHMTYYLFVDSINGSGFRKYDSIAASASSLIFAAILSSTLFKVFVCRTQNRKKDQRKVPMLRIPRQIWFWPVAESAYNAQNANFGRVIPVWEKRVCKFTFCSFCPDNSNQYCVVLTNVLTRKVSKLMFRFGFWKPWTRFDDGCLQSSWDCYLLQGLLRERIWCITFSTGHICF